MSGLPPTVLPDVRKWPSGRPCPVMFATKAALAASKARLGAKSGLSRRGLLRLSSTALTRTERRRPEGIARALYDEGVPTPSREGSWPSATVALLRQRLELT